jgi:hypothetical protein
LLLFDGSGWEWQGKAEEGGEGSGGDGGGAMRKWCVVCALEYQSKTMSGLKYYLVPIFLDILFLCTFSLNSTSFALRLKRAAALLTAIRDSQLSQG